MDECELIVFISAVACGIAKCSSENELPVLAAAFTQLGDTLATIMTKREANENIANQNQQKPDENNPDFAETNPEAGINNSDWFQD